MAIRAVFFDLDDTLVDTSSTRLTRAGLVAALLVQEQPHLQAEELVRRMLEPDPAGRWAFGAEGLVEQLGIAGTAVGDAATGLWYFEGCEHLLTPAEGAVDLVHALHPSTLIGVITNGSERIQRYKFERLGFSDKVSVFLTSDRAGVFKPDPRIFAMALEEAGVQPHEAVFIGDSFDNDVEGALTAGMHAVWFNPTGAAAVTSPGARHYEVRQLRELQALLHELNTPESGHLT